MLCSQELHLDDLKELNFKLMEANNKLEDATRHRKSDLKVKDRQGRILKFFQVFFFVKINWKNVAKNLSKS